MLASFYCYYKLRNTNYEECPQLHYVSEMRFLRTDNTILVYMRCARVKVRKLMVSLLYSGEVCCGPVGSL
jgi:hypothetical protein